MKIALFAEGNGYGHAARDELLSRHFDEPIITFGKGAEYCKKNRIEHIEIPAPYFIDAGKKRVKIATDLHELVKYIEPGYTRALQQHFKDADAVIVDGSPLGLSIAMLMRKKTLFITNDTSSLVGVSGMLQKKIAGSLLHGLLRYPRAIIVPDFPPPLTATALNLLGDLPLVFSGPLTNHAKQKKHSKKYLVLSVLEEQVRPILREKAIYGSEVKDFNSYYAHCETVLTHAGHSSIMEALSFGKPLVCITNSVHPERTNNALALQRNNVGVILEENQLTKESLPLALEYAKTLDRKRLALYKATAKKSDPLGVFEKLIKN